MEKINNNQYLNFGIMKLRGNKLSDATDIVVSMLSIKEIHDGNTSSLFRCADDDYGR